MTDAGKRLIEGAQEALAIARGEQPAASIMHNGHRYVPASAPEEWTVPIHRDGNYVFIDGPGDVELDHGGKMRAALQWIVDNPGAHPMNMWRVAMSALSAIGGQDAD